MLGIGENSLLASELDDARLSTVRCEGVDVEFDEESAVRDVDGVT